MWWYFGNMTHDAQSLNLYCDCINFGDKLSISSYKISRRWVVKFVGEVSLLFTFDHSLKNSPFCLILTVQVWFDWQWTQKNTLTTMITFWFKIFFNLDGFYRKYCIWQQLFSMWTPPTANQREQKPQTHKRLLTKHRVFTRSEELIETIVEAKQTLYDFPHKTNAQRLWNLH